MYDELGCGKLRKWKRIKTRQQAESIFFRKEEFNKGSGNRCMSADLWTPALESKRSQMTLDELWRGELRNCNGIKKEQW